MITRRKRKNGQLAYQVRVSVKGRRYPAETFDTLTDARKREAALVGAKLPGVRERADAFATRWPEAYPVVKTGPTRGKRKSAGTLATNANDLKPFIEHFHGLYLGEITRVMARQFAVAHPRSAAVARNVFSDAREDGLVEANPFSGMCLEQSKGRSEHAPLTEEEFNRLADVALDVHGAYGNSFRALVLHACYVGGRLRETLGLEWRDHYQDEVHFRWAKFDKSRTVLLLPEARQAMEPIVRRVDQPRVFRSKQGRPLATTNHYALWNPVRHVFWQGLSEQRRSELVDLDWHSLRHACGFHFYVTLGFTAAETAHQLGHADESLVVRLYGHGKDGALERMKAKLRRAA